MTAIILTIALTIIFYIIAGIVLSVVINYRKYKPFKKIYDTLPYRKFYLKDDLVYSSDGKFIWFLKDSEFRLDYDFYLYGSEFFDFDPYTYYWLLKYRRWFKNNIYIKTLPGE